MPRARRAPEPPVYTFRVRILGGYFAPPECRSIWREIAIAANQTLGDLGHAIPLAFGFDDPHLWSFFLSGKAWDTASEYASHCSRRCPDSDSGPSGWRTTASGANARVAPERIARQPSSASSPNGSP